MEYRLSDLSEEGNSSRKDRREMELLVENRGDVAVSCKLDENKPMMDSKMGTARFSVFSKQTFKSRNSEGVQLT